MFHQEFIYGMAQDQSPMCDLQGVCFVCLHFICLLQHDLCHANPG